MLTPDEIVAKAGRRYPDFLRAWLRGESFQPLTFSVGSIPDTWDDLNMSIERLLSSAKTIGTAGYRVEMHKRSLSSLGIQTVPKRIWIDTQDDFLRVTGKQREFEQFCTDVELIRARLPALNLWLQNNPQVVVKYHGEWQSLLDTCVYLLTQPYEVRFRREIPLPLPTKFLEQHERILTILTEAVSTIDEIGKGSSFAERFGLKSDEPLFRLRMLDEQLERRYGLPISDLSIPVSQLNQLDLGEQTLLIVENKTTFLLFPPVPNTIILFGEGYAVKALKGVVWLHKCRLLYWGDLDVQGFEILSMLREHYPHTRSILMNMDMIEILRPYLVVGVVSSAAAPAHLTPSEQHTYLWLRQHNMRLEQERISLQAALDAMNEQQN